MSKQFQVILTMNGKQAEETLKTLKERASAVKDAMSKMTLESKEDDQAFLHLQKEFKILDDLIRHGKQELKDYREVLKDLGNSKLSDLNRALREIKREMSKMSEKDQGIDKMRSDYEKIVQQIRKLGVEYVNVGKILKNIDSASEKQLRQALSQTRELHAETARNTAEYKNQAAVIEQLEKALNSGNEKKPFDVSSVMGNLSGSTVNDINTAISAMEKLRGQTIAGSPEWKKYGDQIAIAKEHLAKFTETTKKMSLKEANDIGGGIGIDNKSISELKEAISVLQQFRNTLRPGDTAGLKDIDDKIMRMRIHLGEVKTETVDIKKVLSNLKSAPISDLKAAAAQLEKEMSSLNRSTDEYSRKKKDLESIKNEIDAINGHIKKQGNVISQVAKRLSAYVLIYSGFNIVKNKLGEVVQMNLELSDSLADIRKTTGLANAEVEMLADNLLKLDTRTTAADLNQLAYQAGRMGVGKYGMEGVAGFVRAANEIKIALGEDLGENSIEQVYKLADVMGVIPKMGIEGSLLSIGSAINELVQTGTSSGEFIVDFTSRMAGIAAQANLSTAEVAAFGSALDEMGQEVEVSATSMNKFVMQMFTHYKLVAKAADMSEETLKNMLENGQTADAIVAVMEGLSQKGGLSLLAPLFKDLGSDGARLSQTLAAMSSNVDKLKSSLGVARQAFNEARSVTNEYNIKNETTAALLERIKNSWTELFVNSKNNGMVHQFVVDLKEMSDSLQENAMFMSTMKVALKSLVVIVEALVALTPSILTFLALRSGFELMRLSWIALSTTGKGLGAIFDLLRVGVLRLFGVQATCTAGTLKLAAAWKSLNVAMKANIITAVISLVVALGVALMDAKEKAEDLFDVDGAIKKDFLKYKSLLADAQHETTRLFDILKKETSTKEDRLYAIKTLNEQYADYLPNLISEKDSIEKIKEAQDHLNDALVRGLALRAKQESVRKTLNPLFEDLGAVTNRYEDNRAFENDPKNDIPGAPSRTKGYSDSEAHKDISVAYKKGFSRDDILEYVLQKAEDATGYNAKEDENPAWTLKQARLALSELVDKWIEIYDAEEKENKTWNGIINGFAFVSKKKTDIVDAGGSGGKGGSGSSESTQVRREYSAVMDNIREFFEILRNNLNENFNKGLISETFLDMKTRDVKSTMNRTLSAADKAVVSGDVNAWNGAAQGLASYDFANTPESQAALNKIMGADMALLHTNLKKFGEGFIDEIAQNAAKRQRQATDDEVKAQKDVIKLLLENDYKGKTANEFQQKFEGLGLMNAPIPDGNIEDASGKVTDTWDKAIEHIRKNYEQLFYMDIDKQEGLDAFVDFLKPLEEKFPDILNKNEEQLKLFFQTIMEFHDADDEARRRAERDEERLMKYRFNSMDSTKERNAKMDKNQHEQGWTKVMGSVGLSTDALMADQEVEMYKLKLEAAAEYYEFVMTHAEEKANRDKAQQELDQATMEMTEKLVAKVGEHLAYLKEYGDAIADFGTDFGEAIFGSLEDRQKAITDLGKAFAQTTKKIILDWVKQRMMHKIHTKLMKKETQNFQKDKNKEEEEGAKKSEGITKVSESLKEETVKKAGAEITKTKKEQTAENISDEAKATQATGAMGIAQGAAKTIGKLGWWGIPLVAVIEALLNGLLSAAMSKVSSLFGGGSDKAAESIKPTKLVSGMLTYDNGNVQELSRFIGDDGVMYTVQKAVPELQTGLVSQPIATMVNGIPALVGERGPEMVIGRETTQAMMMARPDLVRAIAEFDRNHSGRGFRTYDAGNLGEVAEGLPADTSSTALLAALQELSAVNAALTAQLQQGIKASINKFGRGGLAEEVVDALDFEMRNGNNPQVKRLFRR